MSATRGTQKRVEVLVVDDSEDQRHLLQKYFELAGCHLTVAESAELAILAYADLDLDLAVIDLVLPGMNGWDLTDRIRVDRPGCKIAITSVLDVVSYPVADARLPKPVSRAKVREVLKNCVPRWAA